MLYIIITIMTYLENIINILGDYPKNPQRQKYFKYPQMKTETRAKLVDYYKPLNEEFFKMIGKKFNWEV